MLDALLVYATISLILGLPSYVTGWLVLRALGRNVESVPAWWSRTTSANRGKAGRSAFLKYKADGREILTAEYAFQVGCLLWFSLCVLFPLFVWFLVSVLL